MCEYIGIGGTSTSLQHICSQYFKKREVDDRKRQKVIESKRRHNCIEAVKLSIRQNYVSVTLKRLMRLDDRLVLNSCLNDCHLKVISEWRIRGILKIQIFKIF